MFWFVHVFAPIAAIGIPNVSAPILSIDFVNNSSSFLPDVNASIFDNKSYTSSLFLTKIAACG